MTEPLTVSLTGDTDLTLTRSFAAPAALVWRAETEPALITQWLWARIAPMTLCEQDFRVGGSFRWVWRMASGTDLTVTGTFLEIAEPTRLDHTEIFDEDWTSGETIVTQIFDALTPHSTRMTMTIRSRNSAARDAVQASKATSGMEETYAQIDSLLAELIPSHFDRRPP